MLAQPLCCQILQQHLHQREGEGEGEDEGEGDELCREPACVTESKYSIV